MLAARAIGTDWGTEPPPALFALESALKSLKDRPVLPRAAGLDWRSDGQGRGARQIARRGDRARYLRTVTVTVNVDWSNASSYTELSDEQLLCGIELRDQLAFEALYDRHAGHVGGICLRRLRNPEVAAELTQDIFTQLWNGASRFEPGRAKFTTWLFTIVRNRCIDAARKVERAPLSEQFEDEYGYSSDKSTPDPESATYTEQCRTRLVSALASLPDAQREAVQLCIVEGYSHREAAERLGQPLGTLKSRVKIGLDKLKSRMSKTSEMKPNP